MAQFRTEADAILRQAFGEDAKFRSGQFEAIDAIRNPGAKRLVVQRTGWGKSIVYFVATSLNRREGKGVTLLISPLLALMRNQIEMALRMGVRAASINSTNDEEWASIEQAALAGEVDALFVSPERLGNFKFEDFLEKYLPMVEMLVIDEAHCISDWGHDFRPDYRRILPLVARLKPEASILATTATATERVIEDVARQLGRDVQIQRGTILRESLRVSTFELPTYAERLAWLEKFLPRFEGTGIVYTLTVHDAEQVAEYLKSIGMKAERYHGALNHDVRLEIEARFGNNELKAICATSALGMGYDKGDVGFVVHYQLPPSMLAYYQQIGRAGRMLDRAFACLLFGESDLEIASHFASTAIPPRRVFDQVLGELDFQPKELGEITKKSKVGFHLVLQAMDLLLVDEIIEKRREGYVLNRKAGQFDESKYRELQELRIQESLDMLEFARSTACRMQSIGRMLGERGLDPCGKCDNCKLHAEVELSPDSIRRADLFLRESRYVILPRAMTPGVKGSERGHKIDEKLRLEAGVALAIYNDAGFGRLVREAKYGSGPYSKELVEAAAQTIAEMNLAPDWVAWVPSKTNHKVEKFARALAAKMGLPAREAIKKVEANGPQKAMLHSLAQYMNVRNAFEAIDVLPGRCLLVDDIVDSGWTLTMIGARLREAGSGPVIPFALATSKPRRPQ